jgi:hypothetical protein
MYIIIYSTSVIEIAAHFTLLGSALPRFDKLNHLQFSAHNPPTSMTMTSTLLFSLMTSTPDKEVGKSLDQPTAD